MDDDTRIYELTADRIVKGFLFPTDDDVTKSVVESEKKKNVFVKF